ncbi:MAG: DUF5666 domain-containing protein [Acidobacteria bacterium]|nr:DUF5666 domain-containing protein [Acidobacteriota bacterium]
MNRRFALYAVIFASMALFGCMDEGKITATSGQGVVSGQVVLSSELSGSAEGIEASIVGTGMSIILAADGHFLFAGVPNDATLRFARVSDGIDAALAVNGQDGGELVVELGRSSASRARRAVRAQLDQYEGLVTELAADSLTMDAAGKGSVVILVNEDTEIRRANQVITLEEIEVGDRIHVKAKEEEGDVVAKVVMLQSGDDSEDDGSNGVTGRLELEGKLLAVSETEVEIDAAGRGPVVVEIDEYTVIRKGNRSYAPADLMVGWRVHIKAVGDGESVRAIEIMVQNTNIDDGDDGGGEDPGATKVELEGLILTVSATEISVDAAGKGPTTAIIDDGTVIRSGNENLAPEDLKPGDRVHVKAERDGEDLVARTIILQRPA